MTTTGRTRAELAAWLDRWNENGAAPSAETCTAQPCGSKPNASAAITPPAISRTSAQPSVPIAALGI